MISYINDVELLIFTSKQLNVNSQSKFFVFHGILVISNFPLIFISYISSEVENRNVRV